MRIWAIKFGISDGVVSSDIIGIRTMSSSRIAKSFSFPSWWLALLLLVAGILLEESSKNVGR